MKFDKNWLDKRWVAYTVATCSAVVLYFILTHITWIFVAISKLVSLLSPVLVAIVIAYVLDPVVKIFDRLLISRIKTELTRRYVSVFITAFIVVVLAVVLLVSLIPQLVNSIGGFFENADAYATSFQRLLNRLSRDAAKNDMDLSELTTIGDTLLGWLTDALPKNIGNIATTSIHIGGNIFNLVVSFIMAIYFLCDKLRIFKTMRYILHAILPEKRYDSTIDFWKRCNTLTIRYVVGDFLDGLIVGIANFTFMTIAGIPYKILISTIVGVTNLAPTFGPVAGAIVGGLILLLVNPWDALWFLIFTIILQIIDGYVFKPKFFGGTLGVSSLWILVVLIVGGRMFGVMGILFAVPFAAIMDFIYKDMIWQKIETKYQEKRKDRKQNDI